MFGTTSGTRSTFFSFVVKWNSNGTGIKTVTSTGPFLHWNLQFQWKLHLCLGEVWCVGGGVGWGVVVTGRVIKQKAVRFNINTLFRALYIRATDFFLRKVYYCRVRTCAELVFVFLYI